MPYRGSPGLTPSKKKRPRQKPITKIFTGTIPKAAVKKGRKAHPKAVAKARQTAQRARQTPEKVRRRRQNQSVRYINRARQRSLKQEKKEDGGFVSDVLDVAGDVQNVVSKTAADIYHESSAEELGLTGPVETAVALFPGGKGVKAVQSAGKAVGKLAKTVFRGKKPPKPSVGKTADKLEDVIKAKVKKPAVARKRRLEHKAKKQEAKAGEIKRGPMQARRERRRITKARKARTKGTAYTKQGQRFRAQQRAAGAASLAAAGAAPVALTATGGERIAEATAEDPGQVTATTLRVAPAMITALAGLPADAVAAARQGNLKPLEGFVEGHVDYLKSLGKIVGEDEEEAKRVIKEELGLIPVATAGLTGAALARVTGPIPKPKVRDVKVARLRRLIETHPDETVRNRARSNLEKIKPPLRERARQRSRTARRTVGASEAAEAHARRELGKPRIRHRPEEIRSSLEILARREVGGGLNMSDLVRVAGATGLRTAAQVKKLIPQFRATMRDPSREILPDTKHTRRVLDALETNPRLIEDTQLQAHLPLWREVMKTRAAEGIPQSVRAQHMTQARMLGEPLTEEMIPHGLKGTKVKPKPGQIAVKAVRQEARRWRKRAGVLRQRAREAQGQRAATLEERADTLEAQANYNLNIVSRQRKAARLDHQAGKARAAGDFNRAESLTSEAMHLRAQASVADDALQREFARNIEKAQQKAGVAKPIYFAEREVGARKPEPREAYTQRIPPAQQRRVGVLMEEGRIDESGAALLENVALTRNAIEMRRLAQDIARTERVEFNGKTVHAGADAAMAKAMGQVPPGTIFVPSQELTRAFKKELWDEATGELDDSFMAAWREATHDPRKGSTYISLNEAAWKEFLSQSESWDRGMSAFRVAARVQGMVLLAASPAWFGYQLLTSPSAAGVMHPNPVRWTRVMREYAREWKKTPQWQRINFQKHYGGTVADAVVMRNVQLGLQRGTVREMAAASKLGMNSPAGRALEAMWLSMRRGGPLIQANRKYESAVRDLTALMVKDKMAHPPRVTRFIGRVGGAHRITHQHLQQLRGKTLREQMEFYDKNPRAAQELGHAVDEALGDWRGLTKAERGLASATVFYPFLRFSLRWMFLAMPRNAPLRHAALLNLAQSNAQQLQEFLGGPVNFFPQWGNIVTHTGEDGEARPTLALERAAPGGSALIEGVFRAASEETLSLQTVTRPLQPLIGGAASILAGQDPLSGRELKGSKLEELAKLIVGLPTPTRGLARKIGPERTAHQQAFDEITGRKGQLMQYLIPQVLIEANRQREAAEYGRALGIVSGEAPSKPASEKSKAQLKREDKAREHISRVLKEFGIPIPAGIPGYKSETTKTPSLPGGDLGGGELRGGGLAGGGLGGGELRGGGLGGR